MVLEIATPFNWHEALFCTHISLATLFRDDDRFEDAQPHIERAGQYTAHSPYYPAFAMRLQADIGHKQDRLEDARSEAFEKPGATRDVKTCKKLLRAIQKELDTPVSSG